VAAVQNQLGGESVDAIYICSEQGDEDEWAGQLSDELDRPTYVFPPFSGLRLGVELSRKLPDHAARFAPLLGMLLDEADGSHRTIDFLHPREQPKARDHRRTIAIAASVLALLLLVLAGKVWFGLSDLNRQITATRIEVDEIQSENQTQTAARDQAAEIEKWLATDVTWLDKLHLLSDRFPASQDAMVTKLVFRQHRSAGGVIDLEGVVRDWDVMDVIESLIPQVEAQGSSDDDTHDQYPQRFSALIEVQTGPEDGEAGTNTQQDAAAEISKSDAPPREKEQVEQHTDANALPDQPNATNTDGEGGRS
jgi:hypothetical protein